MIPFIPFLIIVVLIYGFAGVFTYLTHKHGCSKCGYRRTLPNGQVFCSASCGNNEGKTCSAWYYKKQ